MSNDSYNSEWWKDAKSQSLKRRAEQRSQDALAKLGDKFLIVTEGTITEPVYFKQLRESLSLKAVDVNVLPGPTSDPARVIKEADLIVRNLAKRSGNAKRFANNEIARYDHVWAVVDTDVSIRNGSWEDVKKLAAEKNVKLAHSSPCVEFWLRLHFGYTTSSLLNGKIAKKEVERVLGQSYSTNKAEAKKAIALFLNKWPDAVRHAEKVRAHHQSAGTQLPANPSTEVDRLVRALNDAATKGYRKL